MVIHVHTHPYMQGLNGLPLKTAYTYNTSAGYCHFYCAAFTIGGPEERERFHFQEILSDPMAPWKSWLPLNSLETGAKPSGYVLVFVKSNNASFMLCLTWNIAEMGDILMSPSWRSSHCWATRDGCVRVKITLVIFVLLNCCSNICMSVCVGCICICMCTYIPPAQEVEQVVH